MVQRCFQFGTRITFALLSVVAVLLAMIVVPRIQVSSLSSNFELVGSIDGSTISYWPRSKLDSILGLRGTPKIVFLRYTDPRISKQVDALRAFTAIESLYFDGDPTVTAKFDSPLSVRYLSISSSSGETLGSIVRSCPRIVELDVSFSAGVHDLDLQAVESCVNLRKLTLNGASIKGHTLSRLSKLKSLSHLTILNCPIDQKGIESLSQLTQIKDITLGLSENVSSILPLTKLIATKSLRLRNYADNQTIVNQLEMLRQNGGTSLGSDSVFDLNEIAGHSP